MAGQNPLIRYSFQADEGDDTVYTVVVLEYPAGKAPNPRSEAFYVKMVSAYAKDSQSKVRKRGPATIAGREGFEAITDDGKGKVNHLVDIVPAGDRIYMLISAAPRAMRRATTPSASATPSASPETSRNLLPAPPPLLLERASWAASVASLEGRGGSRPARSEFAGAAPRP